MLVHKRLLEIFVLTPKAIQSVRQRRRFAPCACRKRGGKIVCSPRAMAGGRMAVIQDPAGAVAALFEPKHS